MMSLTPAGAPEVEIPRRTPKMLSNERNLHEVESVTPSALESDSD